MVSIRDTAKTLARIPEAVAISADGTVIVVSAPGTDNGSAYVYTYDGAAWSDERKLAASNGVVDDGFGNSVSVDGDGSVIVTGGFDMTATLNSAEVFVPTPFTDPAIGVFSSINANLADGRARHTSTTSATGSNIVIGGVQGPVASATPIDTIEVFQFSNAAPSVTNVTVSPTQSNFADVPLIFDLSDVEGDNACVFVRYSIDGGNTYSFATLTDYAATVNLQSGQITLNWNAQADGVGSGQSVRVQILPVGGVFGTPVSTSVTFL